MNNMCYSGFFELPTLQIAANFQSSVTCLSLCLQPQGYRNEKCPPEKCSPIQEPTRRLFPISGFPRKLIAQDRLPANHAEDESDSEGEGPVELPVPDTTPPLPGVQKSWGTRLWKSPSLYKTIAQRATTPKPKSPDSIATNGRDASSIDLSRPSSQTSSSRWATSSGEHRYSTETTNSHLESDSAGGDEGGYFRYA
jgi:hypothetical protein